MRTGIPVRRAASSSERPRSRRALSRVRPLRSSGPSRFESYALIAFLPLLAFIPEGFDGRYPSGPHSWDDGEKERRHPDAGTDNEHLRPREDEPGVRVVYDDEKLPAHQAFLETQCSQSPDLAPPLVHGAGADDHQPRHADHEPERQKGLHDLHKGVHKLLSTSQEVVEQEGLRAASRELLFQLPAHRRRVGLLVYPQEKGLLRLQVGEFSTGPLADDDAVDQA